MKVCPECGEMNGDKNTKCFKCGSDLGKGKKICPKCGTIYAASNNECEKCHALLYDYSGYTENSGSYSSYTPSNAPEKPIWAYILAVLMPYVGIVLGLVYMGRKDDDWGKTVLIISVISLLVMGVIAAALL